MLARLLATETVVGHKMSWVMLWLDMVTRLLAKETVEGDLVN